MIAVYVGLDFYLFSDIELVALSGETVFSVWVCRLSYHEFVVHLLLW
jgi:hypothetical protein